LINSGKGLNIFEDGKESRDFVHVQDVADATIAGLENTVIQNDVFNVGNGVATSIMEVAQRLMINYKKEVPVTITGNFRIGDIRHNFADISKISRDLGFRPKYTFENGIKEFCDWVIQQDTVESKFEASLEEMKAKKLFK
jgi:dTDP-L-rhamnose 4-epimerase